VRPEMASGASVLYEVTATVRPEIAEEYERYLRQTHVPDLLATGHFTAASVERTDDGRVRTRYEAPDLAHLERYLAEDAPRLRAHAAERFPTGLALSREIWTIVQRWTVAGAPAAPRA
jgi:hypothetical protein